MHEQQLAHAVLFICYLYLMAVFNEFLTNPLVKVRKTAQNVKASSISVFFLFRYDV